jgi:hypothetical protein
MLVKKYPRTAATWLGLVITLLVLFIYLPILAVAVQPSEINEGLNYFGDTLLFGGMALLLAAAIQGTNPARSPASSSVAAS